MKHKSDLVRYLETMVSIRRGFGDTGLRYICFEDFVINHGEFFPRYVKRPRWVKRGVIKECFSNCLHAVQSNPSRLTYVEGYANSGLLPVHHAWCVTRDGEVIDPTWSDRGITGVEYFGVPFKFSYVCRIASETGYYGVMDNFVQSYPLLRGEDLAEEFLESSLVCV